MYMDDEEIIESPSLPASPEYPITPSAMDGEIVEDSFSSIAKVDPDIAEMDWLSMAILNGRNEFIVLHDIKGYRSFSPSTYYKIMGKDHEPLLKGKKLLSLPGRNDRVYIKDLNNLSTFTIKFITHGCFPVLKKLEVTDGSKKMIGIISKVSKVLSLASFRITNEPEGSQFHVRSKLNLIKGHDYEILGSGTPKKVATIDRQGPAHFLNVTQDAVVTCYNKSLFIALCIFLDLRRRQWPH